MSIPVTVAPRWAMASARMPPPQPTSTRRLPGDRRMLIDVVGAQGIDVVQRLELTAAIPPARGQGLEFGDFLRVDVAMASHWRSVRSG